MARSLLRAEQIRDLDIVTEEEHTSEINHYYRDLKDVTTYSGHANEYVVVNASGTGLEFSSSTSGEVEGLSYNSSTIMSTVASGVVLENTYDAFYFGTPTTSGTWRINRTGDDMVFERYNGETWTETFRIPSTGLDTLEL
jgi:hypothetical protein